MNIDDDDDDDYYRQSTTACCPRQTIPDSCSCPEEAVSAIHGLAAFLAARLDEEEREAKYALERLSECAGIQVSDPDDGGDIGHMVAYSFHALRHNPARVLRDIEADRKLLAIYAEVAGMDCDDPEPEYAYGRTVGLGEAVRLRAARFNGHPDYRQEWKP